MKHIYNASEHLCMPSELITKFLCSFLLVFISLPAIYSQTYNMTNDKVVVEMESKSVKSPWVKKTGGGVTFFENTQDFFQQPDNNGIYNYSINFPKTGIYRINMRSTINHGHLVTEANDVWMKFPNPSNKDIIFFGYKGNASNESQIQNNLNNNNNIVYPKGSIWITTSTTPNGAGKLGWFKVFMNKIGWIWSAKTSDHDGHKIYVKINKTGTYTFQISPRSGGHAIDKFAIWKVNTHGDDGGEITGGSGGGSTDPAPTCSATLAPLPTLDENDAPITLSGGSPSGGTYSGPGVTNGKFDPGIGEGTYTIKYTVTVDGCTASASRNITVTSSSSDGGGSSGGSSGPISFVLVNTNTQNDITTLNNNSTIDLNQVGKNIGIRATGITTGAKFTLTGPFNHTQSEGTSSPWSLFGDIGDNINPWPSANLKTGNYTLSLNANNTTTTINFSITEGSGGSTGGGGSSSSGISFVLVNTNTQNDITTMSNNSVIDLNQVGKNLGIRATGITTGAFFTLTGPFNHTQSEGTSSPWSLFGDIGTNINPWPIANLKTGSYKLSVNANNTTTTINFSITEGSGGSGSSGISAVLVNTNTQNDITTINNGHVIDLSKVGNKIGIRAAIPGGVSTGVGFTLTGPFSTSRTEGSTGPWSLFGDIGVKINPWPSANLKTGNYTLQIKANGTSITVSFQIISGTTANARDISPDFPAAALSLPQITSVYPNPVADTRLNIAFSKPLDGQISYSIYDPTGRVVQIEDMDVDNTVLLKLRLSEAVSPGMYYLKVKSWEHHVIWNHRFIKTH